MIHVPPTAAAANAVLTSRPDTNVAGRQAVTRTYDWANSYGSAGLAGETEAQLGAFFAWCIEGRLAHP
ncbi:hypothetical protein [Phenylobacterium immobile]|uniref:hypothetical protein n=1 Tax=Phenylobacterium immobile TaxID=21 RepID=UPI000B1FD9B5|nr:hypothetical protein [Phenylobacterium immobile]